MFEIENLWIICFADKIIEKKIPVHLSKWHLCIQPLRT